MKDFHILALESSSAVCSVALLSHVSGQVRLRMAQHDDRRSHTEHLLPMADRLLSESGLCRSDLSAIAFGRGPGSFTGLRVACAVAQGLGFALGIPLLPVDSMCAIAMQSAGGDASGVHLVLQDARMNEIYVAVYHVLDNSWVTLQSPALLARADLPSWVMQESAVWAMHAGSQWHVHGDALGAFPGLAEELRAMGALLDDSGGVAQARASTIARLAEPDWCAGRGIQPQDAAPVYVRNKIAYTTVERLQGQGGNPAVQSSACTLHDMTMADLEEVVAIERQVQSFPWTHKNFHDGLKAGQFGWVVRKMGAMLGFALVLDTPDMTHLLIIGVRPDAQRQGVGRQLLEQCIAHARRVGRKVLTLEVRPSNTKAIAFYRDFGFEQKGLRRAYYPAGKGKREDAWLMSLDLERVS